LIDLAPSIGPVRPVLKEPMPVLVGKGQRWCLSLQPSAYYRRALVHSFIDEFVHDVDAEAGVLVSCQCWLWNSNGWRTGCPVMSGPGKLPPSGPASTVLCTYYNHVTVLTGTK
jgi:hypothetical protein